MRATIFGKIRARQRPIELMRTVQLVLEPSCLLIMVGGGELSAEVNALAASDPTRFRVLPFQNQSRMPVVYRLGDLFILPSKFGETWGLAVNEALACGRPVLVSNHVGYAHERRAIRTFGGYSHFIYWFSYVLLGKPRPDLWQLGFALDYSIPYLEAKVQSVDLPDFVRALTPLVEVLFGVPSGSSFGARTTITVAPGVNYAGGGWEFGLEALLPATRATGSGVGVAAQLHFSLDYLFAGGFLGRPIFSSD